ncbi:MAG: copper amine oxidase N-terminal domain-containing protein [Defluviitaleaceae bacterium]|nr:copper amine oxidase N-terminal domain-containing protein [Defluviitaleaceae bacterium]
MKKFIPAMLIILAFILTGCGRNNNNAATAHLENDITALTLELAALNQLITAIQDENADLKQQLNEISAPTTPRLIHGLYTHEVKAALTENEDFLAEIIELAGFQPGFPLEPMTITDRYILFPRGLVSYSVDPGTREFTWNLIAYELGWMGWRHVREAPTPRKLSNQETVQIRIYALDGNMNTYHQSTLEIPGENLWHELTQMWGIRDAWYVGDVLHIDFHPHMEMAFNIGLGSLMFADSMLHTLFSLPNVADIIFTLDGGEMMHGYLGFCLRERIIPHYRAHYAQVAGYVTSIDGSREFADWLQIHIQDGHGNPAIIIATARTVFPRGNVAVGDFITIFAPDTPREIIAPDDTPIYFACVIVPGPPAGMHVSHFVSGMGILSGQYISIDKDFVMTVNNHTTITNIPVHEYRWLWEHENSLHNIGIAVIYNTSTNINGRQHVAADEVFMLNTNIARGPWHQIHIIPETFALSDFEAPDMNIYVQGERILAPQSFIYEETIMVPVTAIAEALTATVTVQYFNIPSEPIPHGILGIIVRGEDVLTQGYSMRIGSPNIYVPTGIRSTLSAPVLIVDGVIYVSLEFFEMAGSPADLDVTVYPRP